MTKLLARSNGSCSSMKAAMNRTTMKMPTTAVSGGDMEFCWLLLKVRIRFVIIKKGSRIGMLLMLMHSMNVVTKMMTVMRSNKMKMNK